MKTDVTGRQLLPGDLITYSTVRSSRLKIKIGVIYKFEESHMKAINLPVWKDHPKVVNIQRIDRVTKVCPSQVTCIPEERRKEIDLLFQKYHELVIEDQKDG